VKNQEVTQAVSEETKLEKLGNDINSTEEHLRLDVSARIKELANLQEAAQAKVRCLASAKERLWSGTHTAIVWVVATACEGR